MRTHIRNDNLECYDNITDIPFSFYRTQYFLCVHCEFLVNLAVKKNNFETTHSIHHQPQLWS